MAKKSKPEALDAEYTEEDADLAHAAEHPETATPKSSGTSSSGNTLAPDDVPEIFTLPPNILLMAIIAGLILNWIIPVSFGHSWGALGLILVLGSIGLGVWCKKLFDAAGTNIRPDMPTESLVTDGPYQYSRNPVYVAFLLGYAGLAMLADAPMMLLMLAPLWYILDRYVVQPEETYLADKFGGEYLEYQSLTERWITIKTPA